MSTVASHAETRIVIDNVSWAAYDALVRGTDRAGTRFTYDRGVLEIMSPSREHERVKRLLGRMVEMLTFERKIAISSSGSTTLRDVLKQRGLEPDECYYILHEPEMRGRDEYDPAIDPPPDLAIEVDLSQSSVDKHSIYADLGVPEIWTFTDDRLKFFQLESDGAYRPIERSLAFAFLKPGDLQRFLDDRHGVEETAWMHRFCHWVRTIPE
jgi:Uma2 family endonuclease